MLILLILSIISLLVDGQMYPPMIPGSSMTSGAGRGYMPMSYNPMMSRPMMYPPTPMNYYPPTMNPMMMMMGYNPLSMMMNPMMMNPMMMNPMMMGRSTGMMGSPNSMMGRSMTTSGMSSMGGMGNMGSTSGYRQPNMMSNQMFPSGGMMSGMGSSMG